MFEPVMKKRLLLMTLMLLVTLATLAITSVSATAADTTQRDGHCVIPESGPWPPCATGGVVPDNIPDGCVIPPSGPWPPCATGGNDDDQGETVQLATAMVSSQLSNQPGRAIVSARGNHFVVDSVPPLEGPNEEINPLDMALGSLATCGIFIAERAAEELDYPLATATAHVETDFDPSGVAGSGVNPRLQVFRVHLDLPGLTGAQITEVVDRFEVRCPIYTTLSRSAPIAVTTGTQAMAAATEGLATAKASAQLSNQRGRAIVTARGNHFVVDSVPPLDGPNEERNPLDLMLGALATCGTFVYEKSAIDMGSPLSSVTAVVEGDFDPRGVRGADVNPRLRAFRVHITLAGASADQVATMTQHFQDRCPIYTTLIRSAPIVITTDIQN